MRRLWLIARREVAAYATVPSFWIALLMGPVLLLLTGLAGGLSNGAAPPPTPAQTVLLRIDDPALRSAALEAIAGAERLGSPRLAVFAGQGGAPDTVIDIGADVRGELQVAVRGRPISEAASAVLQRDLATALRRRALAEAGVSAAALEAADAVRVRVEWIKPVAAGSAPVPGPQVGRFAVVMLLWMNLIGALGMLLQAIVRERSNRALDSLLASARSVEIIFGKLLGVGLLSLVVLAAWLGAGVAVAASPLGGGGKGLQGLLLGVFRDPGAMFQAVMFYLAAFAMYGSAMIGVGALAKDLPSAQNLSRPIFGVLLLVFFVTLTQLTGAMGSMTWLAWLPPFAPFVILMAPPGAIPLGQVLGAFALMLVTTAGVGAAASMALTEKPFGWVRRPVAA